MMCSNPEDLHEMADWSGKGTETRQKLIEKLQGNLANQAKILVTSFVLIGYICSVVLKSMYVYKAKTQKQWY